MNRYHNPIYWFFSLSLALHIALVWSGVLSLSPPSVPPVKVHHLKLSAGRSTSIDKPKETSAPAAAAAPPTQPQVKKAPRPQPRKVRKAPPPRPQSQLRRPPQPPSPPELQSTAGPEPAKSTSPGQPSSRLAPNSNPASGPSQGPAQRAVAAESRYLQTIRARILRHRQYPALSRQRGHEGVAQVRFTVAASGSLQGGVQMVNSSGYSQLDKQAQQCVRAAAPFPPFPAELHKSQLTVIVPVAFRLSQRDS